MCTVYPDYYKDFKCIADKCKHNCCIGWEIDIDCDTAEYYKAVGGDIGKRMREHIDFGDVPHFILGEGERCPFLNSQNLCDIIINCGEEHLCTVCAKHPRFENELPDRCEIGIGMACEEAARLILSQKEPFRLVGAPKTDDEIIILRDRIIEFLQNEKFSIDECISQMLSLCGTRESEKSLEKWADILLSLERLDEKWTEYLCLLQNPINSDRFGEYISKRESEYRSMLVYFIYRHFANAPDLYEGAARACFAALAYRIIYALGAATYNKNGSFSLCDQTELCRLFSSEIEYSDENLYILLDEMYPPIPYA